MCGQMRVMLIICRINDIGKFAASHIVAHPVLMPRCASGAHYGLMVLDHNRGNVFGRYAKRSLRRMSYVFQAGRRKLHQGWSDTRLLSIYPSIRYIAQSYIFVGNVCNGLILKQCVYL